MWMHKRRGSLSNMQKLNLDMYIFRTFCKML